MPSLAQARVSCASEADGSDRGGRGICDTYPPTFKPWACDETANLLLGFGYPGQKDSIQMGLCQGEFHIRPIEGSFRLEEPTRGLQCCFLLPLKSSHERGGLLFAVDIHWRSGTMNKQFNHVSIHRFGIRKSKHCT